MKPLATLIAVLCVPLVALAELPKPMVTGLKNPESVAFASDGRLFVSVIGEPGKAGDGGIYLVKDGKAELFSGEMDDPKGIVILQNWLFVTDVTRVRRVDLKTGKSDIWADEKDFPTKPTFLNDVCSDEIGNLYVSDSGDKKGAASAIFRIGIKPAPKKSKDIAPTRGDVTTVLDDKTPWVKMLNGVLLDSQFHLLTVDFMTGELYRVNLADKKSEKIAEGFPGGDGLVFDSFGRLTITSWKEGKMWAIPRPGEKPILMAEGFQSAADHCYDRSNNTLLIPDMKAGTITAIPANLPGWEVDMTPLKIETTQAFGGLKWTNWDSGADTGKIIPLRPIVLTHANDGSNRNFVATQQGVIHVFANDENTKETKVFLDIQPRVFYADNENEQGLLGLCFHPDYKKNGEFFVFYTDKKVKLLNKVSRFKVSKDDPNKADPASEEVLMNISHKFWNHDGGTVAFGKDGYLYIALGDGGSGGDPDDNAQNLGSNLGKILRIDVNVKGDKDRPYGIPKDNPHVNTKGALPEIYVNGIRNPWRISFDRKTGQGWIADVGQNLWEEINLLEKGANYGWRRRESLHPFFTNGEGPKKEYTDPIWEYHHEVGKSITGGFVYRGKQLPELEGLYIYADYVSGKLWALKYDETKKRVVANRPIKDNTLPIMSFGEDEDGEIYLMTYAANGKGIYKFKKQ